MSIGKARIRELNGPFPQAVEFRIDLHTTDEHRAQEVTEWVAAAIACALRDHGGGAIVSEERYTF